MKLQIIQLEPYDDVISVRDRLSFVKTERVLLVWPRASTILKRKLDLVLIQREAARRGARLALVTNDLDVIEHATELNISTFDSPNASYKARWKRPRNKVFIDRSDRPDNAPDAYELRLAASRLRPLTPQQQRTQRFARIIAALILVTVIAAVIYLFVPSAEIILIPAQRQINTPVQLVADPAITGVDVNSGHIPAAYLEILVTTKATIPTTGSKNVPNTLASGTVIFTNNTDSAIFIPAGTVVSTFGFQPARFHTTSDANVDGGQTVQVTIEAMQDTAGAAGNIEANLISSIEGPLGESLAVHNAESTRGGTVRQQGIVTKADADTLLELAREKIRQTSLAEFSPRLTGTQIIVPDSIKIVEERPEWLSYSAFVGDGADNLTLSMQAKVRALVIDLQLARQATLAKLATQIENGWQIVPESVSFKTFKPSDILSMDAKGQVTFYMSASANVALIIDPERVRRQITGVTVSDAMNMLERNWLLDTRYPPEIKVWPEVFRRLPVLPMRITVNVRE